VLLPPFHSCCHGSSLNLNSNHDKNYGMEDTTGEPLVAVQASCTAKGSIRTAKTLPCDVVFAVSVAKTARQRHCRASISLPWAAYLCRASPPLPWAEAFVVHPLFAVRLVPLPCVLLLPYAEPLPCELSLPWAEPVHPHGKACSRHTARHQTASEVQTNFSQKIWCFGAYCHFRHDIKGWLAGVQSIFSLKRRTCSALEIISSLQINHCINSNVKPQMYIYMRLFSNRRGKKTRFMLLHGRSPNLRSIFVPLCVELPVLVGRTSP
jgi:hypothetical protein